MIFDQYSKMVRPIEKHGYGWWAISELHKLNFIGFTGLRHIRRHVLYRLERSEWQRRVVIS